MSVEKGQKYKGVTGNVYEILSDPFEYAGRTMVAYQVRDRLDNTDAYVFEGDGFTLVVEPKYKVGDKVNTRYATGKTIVAVTSEPEECGTFWYVLKDSEGFFETYDETDLTGKAA